ncbi:hypothetical protein C8R46DRAFT_1027531 [Mycena filopes]|nr:hypothetical protein C8R46DRAFT_1027531 [Mycena filopes]
MSSQFKSGENLKPNVDPLTELLNVSSAKAITARRSTFSIQFDRRSALIGLSTTTSSSAVWEFVNAARVHEPQSCLADKRLPDGSPIELNEGRRAERGGEKGNYEGVSTALAYARAGTYLAETTYQRHRSYDADVLRVRERGTEEDGEPSSSLRTLSTEIGGPMQGVAWRRRQKSAALYCSLGPPVAARHLDPTGQIQARAWRTKQQSPLR